MTDQRNLTVKGQVTIPKDVRDALGLKPGEPVAFEREGERVYLRKGDVPDADREKAIAAMRERIRRARERFPPMPMDMTTDEYMAMIREPVPIPTDDDLRR